MWSFSKLKNYETCPYRLVLAKEFKQETNEYAQRGIDIHRSIENFLNGKAEKPQLDFFNDKILELKELNAEAEVRWGLGTDWSPVPWNYASGKCIIDALVVRPECILIIDFKTGKPSPVSHADQAQTYAIAGNIYYPDKAVFTEFWYLDKGKIKNINFSSSDLKHHRKILEARIKRMERDKDLHPKPSKWVCGYCGYKQHCEYNNS